MIKNKINNSFGPVASFAGKVIFIFGLFSSWVSVYSILLMLGGAFFGFTFSCTSIDVEKNRIRFGDSLLGIFRTGNWIIIKPDMTIGIIKSVKVWKTYSWSNRVLETDENDYLIALFNAQGKKLLPLKKTDNLESAKEELYQLGDLLNLRNINQ